MFKKVLIPTDGSDLSTQAALEGIAFAQKNKSQAVCVFVAPEYQQPIYVEIIPPTYPIASEYNKLMERVGADYMQPIRQKAKDVGVNYSEKVLFSNSAGTAIADYAKEINADLIFIGSHGRSGLSQLLLGSVTTKVLNLCTIPVLVHSLKK